MILQTREKERDQAREEVAQRKKDAAIAHFRWVKEHGNQARVPYEIALAELERLEKAGK